MIEPLSNPAGRRALVIARTVSVLVILVGASVLTGWLKGIPALTSLYLPGPTLKTNAALCLVCTGVANLVLTTTNVRRRRVRLVVWLFAIVPVMLGVLTLSEHVFGWDLGIDQRIATEAAGALATTSPNRMGPISSTANLLLGLSLLLGTSRSPRRFARGHLPAFIACVLVLLPLIGYAYGFSELYTVARLTGIALINAVALLALGVAIQAGRPDTGLMALICREDEVGVFARRMLPAAILLPFGSGWLLARTLGYGFVDAPFAISAMSLVLIVLMAGVIWRTGKLLVLSLDARAASERALAESERTLRNTDQQKTEFLATLSHELRNPLAPIRFAVELLGGPPPVAERARQTIERQVRHLTRLIDDLLDLTRINRNKLELHVRPCELRQLVADAVDAVSNDIKAGRHQLEIDLPSQPLWLQVDPDRVVQMLVNLLNNATRYSEPGGKISLGAAVESAYITLYVRDSGHGLEPADLERVFERFVQVGKTRHGGLGIGLALVKALAELHGGSVEARSEGLGQGAEFRVRLLRAAEAPRPAAAAEGPTIAACRILVVDDNRDAADMLGRLLASRGHKVLVVYDAAEALREAATFKLQIGFLDVGMPGMDGYQLAARLRRDPQTRDAFLVAITGWGQEEDRRRALAAGFDAHLTKPADPEHITALLAARFGSPPLSDAPPASAEKRRDARSDADSHV
jgi:signal transduction histidine kinase/ActR/RegA family two-component response regulator